MTNPFEDQTHASQTEAGNSSETEGNGEFRAAYGEEQSPLKEWVTKAEITIIDHPLASVGIAFAAGWLGARLIR